MKIKNIKNIWQSEFHSMAELYEDLPMIKKEDPEAEVLGITQFEYSSGGTGYFLWLASPQPKD